MRRLTFHTNRSAAECLDILRANSGRGAVVATVLGGDLFALHIGAKIGTAFEPVLRPCFFGSVTTTASGALIRGRVRVPWPFVAFIVVWAVFLGSGAFFAVGSLVQAVGLDAGMHSQRGAGWIIPWVVLAVAIIIGRYKLKEFARLRDNAVDYLRDALDAHPAPDDPIPRAKSI